MIPMRGVETSVQMSAKTRALVAGPRVSTKGRTAVGVMISKELPRHDVRIERVGDAVGSSDLTTGRVRFIDFEERVSEPETLAFGNPENRTALDTPASHALAIARIGNDRASGHPSPRRANWAEPNQSAARESHALRKLLLRARASR